MSLRPGGVAEKLPGNCGMIDKSFWKGKRVFLTGHTGFKGSWLSLWLKELGAEVYGYSLAPEVSRSLFEVCSIASQINSKIADVRDLKTLQKAMSDSNPEIVIHMAAQPLVRRSYHQPVETYSTNVMGTVNVLEAARNCSGIKAIINVTTDKVYENKELDVPFKEEDRLGGFDPYSNSKACSELVTASYRSSFFDSLGVKVVTARAGNVIGGGDWSEDRLVPDIIRAYEKNEAVSIRSPGAIRPWQHVLESLSGYLALAQHLYQENNQYIHSWNFGPGTEDFMTVGDIVEVIKKDLPHLGITFEIGKADLHEAKILKLDNSLAKSNLDWSSQWSARTAVYKTFEWYEEYLKGKEPLDLSLSQIREFEIH